MGLFSRFESKAEDVIEGGRRGGIEPVKLAKRAAKEMQREKMVGVGHEYAPTLYNVLLSSDDDRRMSGCYPSLAGELETYLTGQAEQRNLVLDCPPLVRFIVDEQLKHGNFDIIAENVSPTIIDQLRKEEEELYGLASTPDPAPAPAAGAAPDAEAGFDPFVPSDMQAAAYVPEDAPANPEPAYEPAAAYIPADAVPPAPVPAPVPDAAPTAYIPPAAAAQTVLLNQTPQPCAYLVDIDSEACYEITGERCTLGRGTSCDVTIADPGISRHHAELLHDTGGWVIRDTGSTNGTLVNDAQVSQSQLYDGDVIGLGSTRLEFQED